MLDIRYSKVDLSGKSSAGTECNLVGGKEEGLAGLEPEFRTLPLHDTLRPLMTTDANSN